MTYRGKYLSGKMQTFKYTVNNSAFKGEHFTKIG